MPCFSRSPTNTCPLLFLSARLFAYPASFIRKISEPACSPFPLKGSHSFFQTPVYSQHTLTQKEDSLLFNFSLDNLDSSRDVRPHWDCLKPQEVFFLIAHNGREDIMHCPISDTNWFISGVMVSLCVILRFKWIRNRIKKSHHY